MNHNKSLHKIQGNFIISLLRTSFKDQLSLMNKSRTDIPPIILFSYLLFFMRKNFIKKDSGKGISWLRFLQNF